MSITRPSVHQLIDIALELGINLSPDRASEFLELMQAQFDSYDIIDSLPDFIPGTNYPRSAGYRPVGEENRLNAWYYKSRIEGSASGKLQGKTLAIKDNVALAGVPMMNGSRTLEGYVPSFDATIVTRLLDAGAIILGKSTCEHFCMSGGSHTSEPYPVHNPHRPGYSAGGSSSGSAALVASGEVDLAIGGDQGGSIRMPAAFCGVYGMKPTHGLVPYTGVMPIESTLDHVGPITATVRDNALMLEVLAGVDALDPRQCNTVVHSYTDALGRGVTGLKIGVVSQGFELSNMDPRVSDKVRQAAARLSALGATVEEVSIPEHALAPAIWLPIGCEGLTMQMMHGNGMGYNWKGLYDVGLIDAHASWRNQADDLADTLKLCILIGQYGIDRYSGRYYAKAQNLSRQIRAAYDMALEQHDLLLMPTVPIVASPLPSSNATLREIISRAFETNTNTSAFNVTGHPAMSIPCGLIDDLPVGMMLIGKAYSESTIYRAAADFEASAGWQTM